MAGYEGYIQTCDNSGILKNQQIGSFIWYAITYGNGIYVAVGGDSNYQNGQATTSTDGITWTTPVKIQYGNYRWSDITYANGKFVAVGRGSDGAYSTTSTDGITWTTPIKTNVNQWYGITYGNNKFVAVGSDGAIATSTDGVNWTTPIKVCDYHLNGIIYVDGKFVAVGSRTSDGVNSVHDGCIITSTDGVNWTAPIVVGYGLSAITYGNGKFVAAGFNGRVATSTDGVTWKIGYTGDHEVFWRAAAFVNNIFIIAGGAFYNSIYGDAATSTDGERWTGLGFDVNNIHSICVMQ